NEIERAILGGAGGMFRWAACQLASIETCINLPQLRNALASLPKTLNETYARILSRISEENRAYAHTILQWLCFSNRPLELEEAAEIPTIDLTNPQPTVDIDGRLPDPRDILTICSSLVTITHSRPDCCRYYISGNDCFRFADWRGSAYGGEVEVIRLAHLS